MPAQRLSRFVLDPDIHAGIDAEFEHAGFTPVIIAMWVVYDSPRDYPGRFVARLWLNGAPTDSVILADTLDSLRAALPQGLTRLPRLPGDDAAIYETWL